MRTLTKKGYGRIFVEKDSDIESVRQIIKEIDEFEFEYLPNKLIAPFSEYPQLEYVHKFSDMDINYLTAMCWKRGVKIWICDNGHSEFLDKTYEEAAW